MVRKMIIIPMLLIMPWTFSQQKVNLEPGVLKAYMTIAPSTMLNHNVDNFYLSGSLEYYLDNKLSFKGHSYLFVNGNAEEPLFDLNLRSYFGVEYHFIKNNFDAHIGFSPGANFIDPSEPEGVAPVTTVRIAPSVAFDAGINYFVWKYMHFFVDVTYVNARLPQTLRGSAQIDEIILSAGLGFQLPTKRKKR